MGQRNTVTVDRVEQVDDREYVVHWYFDWCQDGVWVCGANTATLVDVGRWGCTVLSEDVPDDVWHVVTEAATSCRDARRAA